MALFTVDDLADYEGPYIYVLQVGDDGPIKIGITIDVRKRLAAIRGAVPAKVMLRAVMVGDKDVERDLLKRFKRLRLNGEWFLAHTEIWETVASLPKIDPRVFADVADEPPPRKAREYPDRMSKPEAEAIWQDPTIPARDAIQMMKGWSYVTARSTFGARPSTAVRRRLTSDVARERGAKGNATRIARSKPNVWKRPEMQPLRRQLLVAWRSREYANDREAADAVNGILRDMGHEDMGSKETVRRVLGKRT